ncbi:hypothetical protein MMC24_006125 [Lignoscripta atroalba]|nr:hypothetical protein [Lignoscripta atroalba]
MRKIRLFKNGSHQQLGPDEEEPVEAEPADGKGKGKAKLKVGQPQPPKGEQPPKGDQPVKGGKKFSTMSYQTIQANDKVPNSTVQSLTYQVIYSTIERISTCIIMSKKEINYSLDEECTDKELKAFCFSRITVGEKNFRIDKQRTDIWFRESVLQTNAQNTSSKARTMKRTKGPGEGNFKKSYTTLLILFLEVDAVFSADMLRKRLRAGVVDQKTGKIVQRVKIFKNGTTSGLDPAEEITISMNPPLKAGSEDDEEEEEEDGEQVRKTANHNHQRADHHRREDNHRREGRSTEKLDSIAEDDERRDAICYDILAHHRLGTATEIGCINIRIQLNDKIPSLVKLELPELRTSLRMRAQPKKGNEVKLEKATDNDGKAYYMWMMPNNNGVSKWVQCSKWTSVPPGAGNPLLSESEERKMVSKM